MGGRVLRSRDISEFAGVELECWFRAGNLKVDIGEGVGECREVVRGKGARVEWDAGWICVDDEAVVDVWFLGPQGEGFVRDNVWVRGDCTRGDAGLVDG